MKTWEITVRLRDDACNKETGETFRHLGRRQIEKLVIENLDLPACVHFERSRIEEVA